MKCQFNISFLNEYSSCGQIEVKSGYWTASRVYKHFQKWSKVEMGELSAPSRAEFEQEVKSVYHIGVGEQAIKHTMGGDYYPFNIDATLTSADRQEEVNQFG
jgi:hypothetical protein